jgi:hypothetical protein
MFTRIATSGVLVCLILGCAKKTAKPTDKSDLPAPPNPQAVAKAKPAEKDDRKDAKPNWLNDQRGEVVKNQLPSENSFGKPDLGIKLQVPDQGLPLPGDPQPIGGAPKGVPQAHPVVPPAPSTAPKAVKPVSEADMKEVWIFIENASGAGGKMPQPALVYSALVKAESKAAELVKDGSIFLTGASARESIWAFEWKAMTQGGWVASQNGVENLTAEELRRRLGR